MTSKAPTNKRYSRKQVLDMYGISNTTLYRWINDNEMQFPKPVQLGLRMVRWEEEALKAFEERRKTQPLKEEQGQSATTESPDRHKGNTHT